MQNIFNRACLYGACFLGAIAAPSIAQPAPIRIPNNGSITVSVTGLRNAEGQVCFSLFNSSQGFPRNEEAIVEEQCVKASEFVDSDAMTTEDAVSTAAGDSEASVETDVEADPTVTFEGLATGNYAVSIIHDENEDSTINTGAFGVPAEGFGFSRNPEIQTRAPRFSEAAVLVVGRNKTLEIALIYY